MEGTSLDLQNVVFFDTETYLTAPGRLAPKLVCATFYDNKSASSSIALADPGIRRFRDDLKDGKILAAHNAPFDLGVMMQNAPNQTPVIFEALDNNQIICTQTIDQMQMAAFGAIDKATRFSLAALAKRHLNIEMTGKNDSDAYRFRFQEFDGKPLSDWPAEAKRYAMDDVIIGNRVLAKQVSNEIGLPPCLDVATQSNFALHLMSAHGVRTDPKYVQEYKAKLNLVTSELRPKVQAAGLLKPDGKKNLAVIRDRIQAALGEAATLTPGGEIQTGYDQLVAAAAISDDQPLVWLGEMAKAEKTLSTYMPFLEEGQTQVVNPAYGFAESFRTSSYEPNIQNLPKLPGVRECIVPRPGFVLVAIDFSMAELCAISQVTLDAYGESAMARALQDGKDVHVVTAASFLGISYEEADILKKMGDAGLLDKRQFSKIYNFGKLGGLGIKKLIELAAKDGMKLEKNQAAVYNRIWLENYPEVKQFHEDVSSATSGGKSGMIAHDTTGYLRGGMRFTELANHFFQHLVAYGARKALYAVAKECYARPNSVLYGIRPIAFVHDEIIAEVPIGSFIDSSIPVDHRGPCIHNGHYSERAEAMSEIMVNEMQSVIKDIPIKTEITVMRRWSKAAKSKKVNGVWSIYEN